MLVTRVKATIVVGLATLTVLGGCVQAPLGPSVAVMPGAPPPVFAPPPPPPAQVSFGFNARNVAFGFSDGYWDRSHAWHRWPSPAARRSWRARYPAHFFPHPHTRYRHAGWGKRWW